MSQSRIKVILDGLYFDTRTQRGKGTAFERLVRQFLLTDPRYAERFDEVWMWSDWPERGARPDRGIDLVARERETGELCAVQCKFYDPATGVITKGDVDSFLAESGTGEFTSRLFVSTTEHWNRAAEQTIAQQAIPVSRIGLEDLFSSTIDWDSFSLETPEVMVRVGRKALREHQFFPRWTWEKVSGRHAAGDDGFDLDGLGSPTSSAAAETEGEVIGNYRRVDNITDATLLTYRAAYGPEVDKEDIFYYVYGLLHHPEYRSRYAADLKKSLPRLPLVAAREDFIALATAGRGLTDLHLDYEQVEPWPLTLTVDGTELPWAQRSRIEPALLRVTKMRYAKTRVDGRRVDDKTGIVYNEHVTVSGIPKVAQHYLLGSRSGLDWLIDRYRVTTDKTSGIVNDPNAWMDEGAGAEPGAPAQPLYLLDLIARVTTVSVRTQEIVEGLPPLTVRN